MFNTDARLLCENPASGGESPCHPTEFRCASVLREPSLWRGIAVPPSGIQRHVCSARTQPLARNRFATQRNPEAPNCTGTQPLARNRRATPLLRSPRLVGTVCCRTSSAPNKKMKSWDSLVATLLLILNGHSGSSPSPSLHHAIWPASVFFGPPLPEDQPAGTRTSPTMTKTNIIIS